MVYENSDTRRRYLFSNDVAIVGLRSDFDDILEQPDTFYVVDDSKPAHFEAETILISSPCGSVWFDFYKEDCARFYLPVWTKQEILDCRELMFSNTPADIVEERYRQCNGNPRYAVRNARGQHLHIPFNISINDFSLNSLVEASVKSGGIKNLFLLLHYRVNDDLSNEGFVFASDYVYEKAYKNLL